MRAWWTYWIAVGLAAVLWIGLPVVAGRDWFREQLHEPLSLAILLIPVAFAGLNLIAFRASHEEVCRLEAQRHSWLRALVGRGYSARQFALTGIVLLGLVVVILAAVATGSI